MLILYSQPGNQIDWKSRNVGKFLQKKTDHSLFTNLKIRSPGNPETSSNSYKTRLIILYSPSEIQIDCKSRNIVKFLQDKNVHSLFTTWESDRLEIPKRRQILTKQDWSFFIHQPDNQIEWKSRNVGKFLQNKTDHTLFANLKIRSPGNPETSSNSYKKLTILYSPSEIQIYCKSRNVVKFLQNKTDHCLFTTWKSDRLEIPKRRHILTNNAASRPRRTMTTVHFLTLSSFWWLYKSQEREIRKVSWKERHKEKKVRNAEWRLSHPQHLNTEPRLAMTAFIQTRKDISQFS